MADGASAGYAGTRLKGFDPVGVAEVASVSRFGTDALNLVFSVDGRVAERLAYRGEEASFEFLEAGRQIGSRSTLS
jgi:hypothetical protein